MKIIRLDVKGFRSFRDVSWTPSNLNVVVGPNGSGKSNLLQVLELISASAQGRLGETLQDLGGLENIVRDDSGPGFALALEGFSPGFIDETGTESAGWVYGLGTECSGECGSRHIAYETFTDYRNNGGESESVPHALIDRRGAEALLYSATGEPARFPGDWLSDEETVLSVAGGPYWNDIYLPTYRAQIASWFVSHGPETGRNSPIRRSVPPRMETRLDPDGGNLVSVLYTLYMGDRDFRSDIDAAMRSAFGDDYDGLSFPLDSSRRIRLFVKWKSVQRAIPAFSLSDGILRFLFLLTALAAPNLPSVIAVDEPAMGLHPAMLPIIADYAGGAATRAQVVFTTHSPQFLDAFGEQLPAISTALWANGETLLKMPNDDILDEALQKYSPGALFVSGELEAMD